MLLYSLTRRGTKEQKRIATTFQILTYLFLLFPLFFASQGHGEFFSTNPNGLSLLLFLPLLKSVFSLFLYVSPFQISPKSKTRQFPTFWDVLTSPLIPPNFSLSIFVPIHLSEGYRQTFTFFPILLYFLSNFDMFHVFSPG